MKAIVFGGAGFLGSHVSDKLTEAGHDVTIFDKSESPYLKEGQKLIIGDIMNEETVFDAVKGNDVLFNFSGIADIEENSRNPLEAVKVNIVGNSILLEAARKLNLKRFVFASSVYVFSKAGMIYRSTKRACEDIIEDYTRIFGLEHTILRYGSLYGPRANQGNSIYNYIKQAVEDRKVVCSGLPDDMREYIHVEDAAKATVDILKPEYANESIILTGKQALRVKDLMKMIDEILGGIEVEYKGNSNPLHYSMTPYSFSPKMGKKLVSNLYIDIGQGILNCIEELYLNLNNSTKKNNSHS